MGDDKRLARTVDAGIGYGPRRVDGDLSNLEDSWKAKAWDYPDQINVGARVGQTRQKGKFDDLVGLFHDRFQKLSKIIKNQTGQHPSGTIREIKNR